MKPENRFRLAVEKLLPEEVHCEKMANPYRAGGADCWYDGPSADMWVEWKWCKMPKRDTTMIVPDLSTLQKLWLRGRFKNGRAVAVIVGTPDGCIVFVTPDAWEVGVTRGEAQVLTKQQAANWIREHVASSRGSERPGGPGGVHDGVLRRPDVECG